MWHPSEDINTGELTNSGFHEKIRLTKFFQNIFNACAKIFHTATHHDIPTKELKEVQSTIDSIKKKCLATEAVVWLTETERIKFEAHQSKKARKPKKAHGKKNKDVQYDSELVSSTASVTTSPVHLVDVAVETNTNPQLKDMTDRKFLSKNPSH